MSDAKETKPSSGLAQRAVTGVVLAVAVLVVIWLPGPSRPETLDFSLSGLPGLLPSVFCMAAAWMAAVGFREFADMARAKNIYIETRGGAVAVVLTILCAYTGSHALVSAALFVSVSLLSWVLILRGMLYHSLPGLAATVFGVIYLGWLPAHLALMHAIPETGPGIVTALIAFVAMSDSGAYFTGRAIGKHKLAPNTSPKKTWEGAFGGVVAAMLTGAVIFVLRHNYQLHALPDYPFWWYLITGAILSVVSQVGDLVESMLKRDAGVKDSGTIFPGHGGVLDRCDGILFAAPALYYLIQLEHGVRWLQQLPN